MEGTRGKAVVAWEETLVNPDNYTNDRYRVSTKAGIRQSVSSPIDQYGDSKRSRPLLFLATLCQSVHEPLWLTSSSSSSVGHINRCIIAPQSLSPHVNSAGLHK